MSCGPADPRCVKSFPGRRGLPKPNVCKLTHKSPSPTSAAALLSIGAHVYVCTYKNHPCTARATCYLQTYAFASSANNTPAACSQNSHRSRRAQPRAAESGANHQGAAAEDNKPEDCELPGAQLAQSGPLAGEAVRGPLPRQPGATDQDAVRQPRHGEQPALRHAPHHRSLRAGGLGCGEMSGFFCFEVQKRRVGSFLGSAPAVDAPAPTCTYIRIFCMRCTYEEAKIRSLKPETAEYNGRHRAGMTATYSCIVLPPPVRRPLHGGDDTGRRPDRRGR